MFEKFSKKLRSSPYLVGVIAGVFFGGAFLLIPNETVGISGRIIIAVIAGTLFGATMGKTSNYFQKSLLHNIDMNRLSQLRKQYGKYYRKGTTPNSAKAKEEYTEYLRIYATLNQRFAKLYYAAIAFFALSTVFMILPPNGVDSVGLLIQGALFVVLTFSLFYQKHTANKMLRIENMLQKQLGS